MSYSNLARVALGLRLALFKLKPKAHSMAHLVLEMMLQHARNPDCVVNPVAFSTFMCEDFCWTRGKIEEEGVRQGSRAKSYISIPHCSTLGFVAANMMRGKRTLKYYIILYYIILYYIILYYIILYYIALYYIILYYIILYYIKLYYIFCVISDYIILWILYYIVLYCIIWYYIVLYCILLYDIILYYISYYIISYYIILCYIVLYYII